MVNAHLEPGYGDFIANKWDLAAHAPASAPEMETMFLLFHNLPFQIKQDTDDLGQD